MTEAQREILEKMPVGGRWVMPLDVGGHDGSHHSTTLAAMVKKGWVERETRSIRYKRPSYKYRITQAGCDSLLHSLTAEPVMFQ
jgi:hypothetical protein